jgi:glycosyltransferase domain-containing protein
MSSRLTIVLAVKDRLSLAYRWLRFMDQERCPYPIIIADGSIDSKSRSLLDRSGDFPNLGFEYIRSQPDTSYSIYYQKISKALEIVNTPYVLMADDDDFFSIDGIDLSIKYLDDNLDFACARGSYMGFSILRGHAHINRDMSETYGEMTLRGSIYPNEVIVEDTAARRLSKYFQNWTPNWYNVHRTKILKKCWNEMLELDLKNIFLMEHTLGAKIALHGKIYAGNYPYYLRQMEGTYLTVSKEAKQRDGDWFDQMLKESWSSDYNAFHRSISQDIEKIDEIQYKNASQIVGNAYRQFMGPRVAGVIVKNRIGIEAKLYWIYKKVNYCINWINGLSKEYMQRQKDSEDEFYKRVHAFLAKRDDIS